MWSLGCSVVELFLGLPLFPGSSEYNQVSRIVEMLGNPPNWMIEVGKQASDFFEKRQDEYGRKTYHLKSMEHEAVLVLGCAETLIHVDVPLRRTVAAGAAFYTR